VFHLNVHGLDPDVVAHWRKNDTLLDFLRCFESGSVPHVWGLAECWVMEAAPGEAMLRFVPEYIVSLYKGRPSAGSGGVFLGCDTRYAAIESLDIARICREQEVPAASAKAAELVAALITPYGGRKIGTIEMYLPPKGPWAWTVEHTLLVAEAILLSMEAAGTPWTVMCDDNTQFAGGGGSCVINGRQHSVSAASTGGARGYIAEIKRRILFGASARLVSGDDEWSGSRPAEPTFHREPRNAPAQLSCIDHIYVGGEAWLAGTVVVMDAQSVATGTTGLLRTGSRDPAPELPETDHWGIVGVLTCKRDVPLVIGRSSEAADGSDSDEPGDDVYVAVDGAGADAAAVPAHERIAGRLALRVAEGLRRGLPFQSRPAADPGWAGFTERASAFGPAADTLPGIRTPLTMGAQVIHAALHGATRFPGRRASRLARANSRPSAAQLASEHSEACAGVGCHVAAARVREAALELQRYRVGNNGGNPVYRATVAPEWRELTAETFGREAVLAPAYLDRLEHLVLCRKQQRATWEACRQYHNKAEAERMVECHRGRDMHGLVDFLGDALLRRHGSSTGGIGDMFEDSASLDDTDTLLRGPAAEAYAGSRYNAILQAVQQGGTSAQRWEYVEDWRAQAAAIPASCETPTMHPPAPHPHRRECADILNRELQIEEMLAAIQRLRNGKAPGNDSLTAEMLKSLPDNIREVLFMMLRCILSGNGRVPEGLKRSLITLIWKRKGDKRRFDSHRGVAVSSVLYKLLATIMTTRLQEYLELLGLLHDHQNLFRRGRSCQQLIFSMLEIISLRWQGGQATYVAFVDLVKAYDSVEWARLWCVLWQHGIRGNFLRVLRELYMGSRAGLRTSTGETIFRLVTRGLKQGCPLSCLLFAIFINSIIIELEKHAEELLPAIVDGPPAIRVATHFAADDAALLASTPTRLQGLLDVMGEELQIAVLHAQPKKTEAIEFLPPVAPGAPPHATGSYTIAGQPISSVPEFPYLGVVADPGLTMRGHAARIATSLRKRLGIVRGKGALGGHVPMRIADEFASVLVDSGRYGLEVGHRMSEEDMALLEVQAIRRHATVLGVPLMQWASLDAYRVQFEMGAPSMRLQTDVALVKLYDRILRSAVAPPLSMARRPLMVAAVAQYSLWHARGLLLAGGLAAVEALRGSLASAAFIAAVSRLGLQGVVTFAIHIRPPRARVDAAIKVATAVEVTARLTAQAAVQARHRRHAAWFTTGFWLEHALETGNLAGHAMHARMRLGASATAFHRRNARLQLSALCPRAGCKEVLWRGPGGVERMQRAEEDTCHAVLECEGVPAAALALRQTVQEELRSILLSLGRFTATSAPPSRDELSKILAGAAVVTEAAITGDARPRTIPEEGRIRLATAVIAYLQIWADSQPLYPAADA